MTKEKLPVFYRLKIRISKLMIALGLRAAPRCETAIEKYERDRQKAIHELRCTRAVNDDLAYRHSSIARQYLATSACHSEHSAYADVWIKELNHPVPRSENSHVETSKASPGSSDSSSSDSSSSDSSSSSSSSD